ncbi:hypothetical protein H9P43_008785 [Blastocladiella emersonii ATCC 22665]|nr:hypothetical protein H9P43_008785 [Blastocladiella emersonii ATCC 22665]
MSQPEVLSNHFNENVRPPAEDEHTRAVLAAIDANDVEQMQALLAQPEYAHVLSSGDAWIYALRNGKDPCAIALADDRRNGPRNPEMQLWTAFAGHRPAVIKHLLRPDFFFPIQNRGSFFLEDAVKLGRADLLQAFLDDYHNRFVPSSFHLKLAKDRNFTHLVPLIANSPLFEDTSKFNFKAGDVIDDSVDYSYEVSAARDDEDDDEPEPPVDEEFEAAIEAKDVALVQSLLADPRKRIRPTDFHLCTALSEGPTDLVRVLLASPRFEFRRNYRGDHLYDALGSGRHPRVADPRYAENIELLLAHPKFDPHRRATDVLEDPWQFPSPVRERILRAYVKCERANVHEVLVNCLARVQGVTRLSWLRDHLTPLPRDASVAPEQAELESLLARNVDSLAPADVERVKELLANAKTAGGATLQYKGMIVAARYHDTELLARFIGPDATWPVPTAGQTGRHLKYLFLWALVEAVDALAVPATPDARWRVTRACKATVKLLLEHPQCEWWHAASFAPLDDLVKLLAPTLVFTPATRRGAFVVNSMLKRRDPMRDAFKRGAVAAGDVNAALDVALRLKQTDTVKFLLTASRDVRGVGYGNLPFWHSSWEWAIGACDLDVWRQFQRDRRFTGINRFDSDKRILAAMRYGNIDLLDWFHLEGPAYSGLRGDEELVEQLADEHVTQRDVRVPLAEFRATSLKMFKYFCAGRSPLLASGTGDAAKLNEFAGKVIKLALRNGRNDVLAAIARRDPAADQEETDEFVAAVEAEDWRTAMEGTKVMRRWKEQFQPLKALVCGCGDLAEVARTVCEAAAKGATATLSFVLNDWQPELWYSAVLDASVREFWTGQLHACIDKDWLRGPPNSTLRVLNEATLEKLRRCWRIWLGMDWSVDTLLKHRKFYMMDTITFGPFETHFSKVAKNLIDRIESQYPDALNSAESARYACNLERLMSAGVFLEEPTVVINPTFLRISLDDKPYYAVPSTALPSTAFDLALGQKLPDSFMLLEIRDWVSALHDGMHDSRVHVTFAYGHAVTVMEQLAANPSMRFDVVDTNYLMDSCGLLSILIHGSALLRHNDEDRERARLLAYSKDREVKVTRDYDDYLLQKTGLRLKSFPTFFGVVLAKKPSCNDSATWFQPFAWSLDHFNHHPIAYLTFTKLAHPTLLA